MRNPSSRACSSSWGDRRGPQHEATPSSSAAGTEAPSREVVVRRAMLGMVSYDWLTWILRALGHASHSMDGAGPWERRPNKPQA